MAAGSEAAAAALFERLEVNPSSAQSAGQSAKDLFAGILGIDAIAAGFDPQRVHMTSESYQRLNQLGLFNGLKAGRISEQRALNGPHIPAEVLPKDQELEKK
ncbi:hypothetical protein [Arthrobacter sp. 08Y14]|uniref:hypothetical protein n=1 Tax=Arthrobacter sp. 08Y14 TaxID=2058885 RepID=UPI000CE30C47|nr:hypothetical protein [Arthrobacter sp. 08Y14]